MIKADFYNLLKAIPKAELHIHEEAVIGNETIKRLYKNSMGTDMPQAELDRLFSYTDLAGFLDSFIKIQQMLVKEDDYCHSLTDFQQYLNDNNIVYCETFFSPTTPLKKGFSFSRLMEILSAGIDKIKAEDGRTVRFIVDVSRSFGLENAQHNLDLVLQEKNPYIIGIGLGGNEEQGPAKDYAPVFDRAKEAGLHTVAHAGETCESWSMKDSINYLHAQRIGHGITAAYDEPFLQELAEKQFPLEICPTSNTFTRKYVTKIRLHQIKQIFKAGVPVTLGTDDPTFFKVSLIDEYWNLHSKLKFSLKDIKQIILNGFNAAFISDDEKKKYRGEVEKAWADWFAAHPQK